VSGPAEARILLLGAVAEEDIVASAAFRLRVVGEIVPAYASRSERSSRLAPIDGEGGQSTETV